MTDPTGAQPQATVRLPDEKSDLGDITAVWQNHTASPGLRRRRDKARRRRFPWVVPGGLFLAALAVGYWLQLRPDLQISGITARTDKASVTCGEAANLVAIAATNGAAGKIRYRWIRSDGTDSGVLTQTVAAGQKEVRLPLTWSFRGTGVHQARAVVDILAPTSHTTSVSFTYTCD
ncbi:hypothetical protein [Streptomyces sp. NPDC127084]|uniref:hypothetical protein n=1 Tax=Streptomyces sp. NPDC127084 TaxID=3347133 RepID=UPI00364D2E5E